MAENATFDSVVVSISFSVVSPDGFKQVNVWVLAEQMTAKTVWGHSYFAYNWLKSEKKKKSSSGKKAVFYCAANSQSKKLSLLMIHHPVTLQ